MQGSDAPRRSVPRGGWQQDAEHGHTLLRGEERKDAERPAILPVLTERSGMKSKVISQSTFSSGLHGWQHSPACDRYSEGAMETVHATENRWEERHWQNASATHRMEQTRATTPWHCYSVGSTIAPDDRSSDVSQGQ